MVRKEQISAWVDDQCDDAALLGSVSDNGPMNETWQRYHLIGDIMRGDAPKHLNLDLADSIAQALESEPVHQVSSAPNVVEFKPAKRSLLPQWLGSFGHYAIAASVAVAAIVGVQLYQQQPVKSSEQPLPVFNTVPVGGSLAPVSLQTNFTPQGKMTDAQWLQQRRQIAAYLQDHQLQQRNGN